MALTIGETRSNIKDNDVKDWGEISANMARALAGFSPDLIPSERAELLKKSKIVKL